MFVDDLNRRADGANIRMVFKERHLPLETCRQGDVGVHPRDAAAARAGASGVKRRLEARVQRLAVHEDARIHRLFCRKQRGRAVGRSVVNDQKLEIRKGLGDNAANGLDDETLAVVDRHHDADERRGHLHTL